METIYNELKVEYTYNYLVGVHTLPSGEPGYPPAHEIDIISIKDVEGDDVMKELKDRDFELINELIIDENT